MKEIDVLGVTVKDCSLRESLKITDGYLRNGAMNTIVYLSSKLLVDAGANEEQRAWIQAADLTIFGDANVLRTIKAQEHRIQEVQEDIYLREFLKKLVRMKRKVFLLSDSKEHMDSLQQELTEAQENLQIVRKYIMEEEGDEEQHLLNEINESAPSVIISRVDYAFQGKLMEEGRKFCNADIWIGLLDAPAGASLRKSRFTKLRRMFYHLVFSFDIRKKRYEDCSK